MASASGHGYAYVTAAYLADELWTSSGGEVSFGSDAVEVERGGGGNGSGGMPYQLPQGDAVKGRNIEGSGPWGGRKMRVSGGGELVRRMLFERDAAEDPKELLSRLLAEVHRWRWQGGPEEEVEMARGGNAVSVAQPLFRVAEAGDVAAAGGPSSCAEADEGKSLRLIRVAGGGCVPRVCPWRVRRWVAGGAV